MSDAAGLEHPSFLQLGIFGTQMLEQPKPVSDQDRYEVDLYFAHESSFWKLLRCIRATGDTDVLVTSGRTSLA